MTIEQKPELNRFVDPTIPLTWDYRWQRLKFTLPVWIFSFLFFLEIGLFKAWLADKIPWDRLAVLLGIWPVMILFVLVVAEIQTRIQQQSKRVIQFKNNKILVKPAKSQLVRWKNIAKFQFEPIPEMLELTKLKLFLHGRPNKKQSKRAFWAMVLEERSQMQELVRFLQAKKTGASTDYEIEILEKPLAPEHPVPFPFLGMSLYMGGLFLLLHGVPILFAILDRSHHDSDGNSKLSPEESAKLGHFILKHFSSKEEFRHFFLTLSIFLNVTGVFLLILGWWLMKRKTACKPNEPTSNAA